MSLIRFVAIAHNKGGAFRIESSFCGGGETESEAAASENLRRYCHYASYKLKSVTEVRSAVTGQFCERDWCE